MLNIKTALKTREAEKAAALEEKKATAAAVKKPVKKPCRESVTTGYASSAARAKMVELDSKPTADTGELLNEMKAKTANTYKQVANFLQRSDVAPRVEKAIREKDDVKARSLIMRHLQCDREVSEKVLQAYRLL